MNSTEYLKYLFKKSLNERSPEKAIRETVSLNENSLRIKEISFNIENRPFFIFAVGKAAVPMALTASSILEDRVKDSLIITPEVEGIPKSLAPKVLFGSHPTPTGKSLKAGKEAAEYFKQIPHNAILLSLISGGTSSLMCLAAESISIDDLNITYELLINSGAAIHEINAIRKHCSLIKGGQLLHYLNPNTTLIDLVISDVPDDNLQDIGSGPTIPDSSTFLDTYHTLLEYELWNEIPQSVRNHIEKGLAGEVPETLKPSESQVKEHHSFIISSAKMLAKTVAKMAQKDGYYTWAQDDPFTEDVEEVATTIMEKAKSVLKNKTEIILPILLVYFGESTVNVTGTGKGGRNQELALHSALKIAGYPQITWLSAGTDGIDGPTDAAGAVVDGNTNYKAEEMGMNPEEYLQRNNSYHFHEKLGTLLKIGPTGNNLMDMVLVLVK